MELCLNLITLFNNKKNMQYLRYKTILQKTGKSRQSSGRPIYLTITKDEADHVFDTLKIDIVRAVRTAIVTNNISKSGLYSPTTLRWLISTETGCNPQSSTVYRAIEKGISEEAIQRITAKYLAGVSWNISVFKSKIKGYSH